MNIHSWKLMQILSYIVIAEYLQVNWTLDIAVGLITTRVRFPRRAAAFSVGQGVAFSAARSCSREADETAADSRANDDVRPGGQVRHGRTLSSNRS